MDLHLEKDHGVGVGVLDREKKDDPEKMQEKIKNIYKKKKTTGYTRPLVTTDISTIYELPKPITYGSFSEKEFRQGEKEFRQVGKENFQEGAQSKPSVAEKEKEKQQQKITGKFMGIFSFIPLSKIYSKINASFIEMAKVIGYNDIQNNALPPNKSLDKVWKENSKWLQSLIFEFFLVFFSYIITYNIYYYTFIYKWEVQTAHFDPKQGFMFGGVFKSFMDDWLMRDIRYPMLFMGYLYSWLIPAFFNLIGVIHYPKLCFLIILLHTMIITFTQGPNAAMSVDSLLGGSPSILILALNIFSCLAAFFDTSMTIENGLAWARFYSSMIAGSVSNIIRLLIAFFGVFISQIMVYFFFIYTTSGFGLLWESKIVNIGAKIKEINDHIGGKSGVGKNYCKANTDTIGLWKFIDAQVEPHFSWLFIYLLLLYIIVKTIATFFKYHGESAKLFLCYFLIILGVTIWLIVTSLFGSGSGNVDDLTTIVVSTDGNEPSMMEKIKQGVEGLSDNRNRTLTNLSNQGNNFLSKTVGQPARDSRNALSDNVFSRMVLGDDTFTALDPEIKTTLQNLTNHFNEMVTNVDSVADGGKEIENVEQEIRDELSNKESESLLQNILQQEKIIKYIQSKIAKGKQIMDILSSMFQYMLSRAGANPKVTELGYKILAKKGNDILLQEGSNSEGPEEKNE
jgi:hypothetical protein